MKLKIAALSVAVECSHYSHDSRRSGARYEGQPEVLSWKTYKHDFEKLLIDAEDCARHC